MFTWSKWVDDASFLVLQHCWDNPSFCRNLIKLPGMYLFIRTAATFSELMLALHFLSRVISSFALFLLFSMFICTSLHLGPFCENTCIFTFFRYQKSYTRSLYAWGIIFDGNIRTIVNFQGHENGDNRASDYQAQANRQRHTTLDCKQKCLSKGSPDA